MVINIYLLSKKLFNLNALTFFLVKRMEMTFMEPYYMSLACLFPSWHWLLLEIALFVYLIVHFYTTPNPPSHTHHIERKPHRVAMWLILFITFLQS